MILQWLGRSVLGLCLGALLLTCAAAQEHDLPQGSPEGVTYDKGKGPGRRNSYVARYEEDYGYLRDPAKSLDPLDAFKFIPLDESGSTYLTLNGEFRSRNDYTQHKNFGVAASATPAKTPGAPPLLTPATRSNENELYKQRYALGGDLHLGSNFRVYGEFVHGQQTGREVGPVVPANQRNQLALINGFGEARQSVGAARLGLRVGRQEVFFGNALNLGANLATNLPDPVFDGVRAYGDWGRFRLDLFAYNTVKYAPGVLDDSDNPHTNLWGGYATADMPGFTFFGRQARSSLDLFYFGFRTRPDSNGPGTGQYDDAALLTGDRVTPTTGSGFVRSQDHRHTFGLRYYGTLGNIDYDWEAMLQRGSYAGLSVDAWAFNTDTGYTFEQVPWKPRIGAHVDAASGGADTAGRTLHTYQPLLPNTYYYLPNSSFAPTNFYDVSPRLSVSPASQLVVEVYSAFLWRYSEADAIYNGNWKFGNGTNAYAPTALVRGRWIGMQPDIGIRWTPTRHVALRLEGAIFFPGAALRAVGGKTTSYVNATLTLKF
jgi:hypothetical protein